MQYVSDANCHFRGSGHGILESGENGQIRDQDLTKANIVAFTNNKMNQWPLVPIMGLFAYLLISLSELTGMQGMRISNALQQSSTDTMSLNTSKSQMSGRRKVTMALCVLNSGLRRSTSSVKVGGCQSMSRILPKSAIIL